MAIKKPLRLITSGSGKNNLKNQKYATGKKPAQNSPAKVVIIFDIRNTFCAFSTNWLYKYVVYSHLV